MIVDLDHFKQVNDRFGHQVGDKTLRTLAGCLRRVARQEDCVARYGGEEFALVLPDAGTTGASALLQRVRTAWDALARADDVLGGSGRATRSMRTRATRCARADGALYAAKDAGRNRDVFAEQEIVL